MDSTQFRDDLRASWDMLQRSGGGSPKSMWIPESLLRHPDIVEEIKLSAANNGYSVCVYNLWGPAR